MEDKVLEYFAREIVASLHEIRDEIAGYRKDCLESAGTKINEFNWKQIESLTQGGVVGATIVPPGTGPRRM